MTGWKAVVAIVLLVLIVGYKYTTAITALDTNGKKVIQDWVASEYQRYHLARTDLSDEEKGAILLHTKSIELVSMTARGGLDSMSVRVVIGENEAHPDGMEYIQYYKLKYSSVSGWQHSRTITALRYYLSF